jgi:hypothetical protein
MKSRLTHFVLAAWLVIISAHSGWSQSSFYLDRGSFILAAQEVPGNQQAINFFSLPPNTQGPVVTISDVTFAARYLSWYRISAGAALWSFDGSPPGISIHFANGARAFGADFSSAYNLVPSFTATLSLDNGQTIHFTAPTDPNFTFCGFVSPTPIMDVTFSDGGLFPASPFNLHQELIANVFVVTVPEPAAIALAGLGAVLLLGWRLRRKFVTAP